MNWDKTLAVLYPAAQGVAHRTPFSIDDPFFPKCHRQTYFEKKVFLNSECPAVWQKKRNQNDNIEATRREWRHRVTRNTPTGISTRLAYQVHCHFRHVKMWATRHLCVTDTFPEQVYELRPQVSERTATQPIVIASFMPKGSYY